MKLNAAAMAERRQVMLKTAFQLFSNANIDSVTMAEIADETGYTLRSLHRYFHTKQELVIEVAAWAFEGFIVELRKKRRDIKTTTSIEDYEFFLNAFLVLYQNRRDLLRFNQFFNIYVRSEHIDADTMGPYQKMIGTMRENFHISYGKNDGTLRMDISEEEIFSTSLHLMLAAVTRYAVGLVYHGGSDQEQELVTLKNMLLARYAA